jgi:glycosyltransferase involved in cell wall biosynthesis
MKKIAIYVESDLYFLRFQINRLISEILSKEKVKFFFYLPKKLNFNYPVNSNICVNKNFDYYLKNSDHRMYYDFLLYLIKNKINTAVMHKILYPEFLLNDLSFLKKKIKTKIILNVWGNELTNKSISRSNVITELLKNKIIYKYNIQSIAYTYIKFPDYFVNTIKKFNKKIELLPEPRHINSCDLNKNKCRKILNIPAQKHVILFFGMPYFGKGFDIFLQAIKSLPKNILPFIVSDIKNVNFKLNNEHRKILLSKQIMFYNESVGHSTIKFIYGASDIVCIPYRKSYLYGTSSIFHESILSYRPVIAPDFPPFDDLIKKFNLGLLFKCGDYVSLRKKIIESIFFFEKENKFKNNCKTYIDFTEEKGLMAKIVLK